MAYTTESGVPARESVVSPSDQVGASANNDAAIRLAAGVAHQLNNMLTVVSGHASLLLETLPEGDPVRQSLMAISEAGEAGADLASQLLSFAGQRPANPRICPVTDLLASGRDVAVVAAGPKLSVTCSAEDGLPNLMVDPIRFEEAVQRLATYGRGIFEGGGEMEIGAEAATALKDVVLITVRLSGPDAQRLSPYGPLQPLATESPRVSTADEIRLAAAWGAVRQAGGSIVADTESSGIRFSMLFPAAG